MNVFDLPSVRALIEAALTEDIGRGDLTTRLTVGDDVPAQARIVAKQDGVAAGLPLVAKIFAALAGPAVSVQLHLDDGESFDAGAVLAFLSGPAPFLLAGERVALNFLQQLSGVATLTRRYVEAVAGTRARIVDTRKTTPGLRVLEKYAVRMGGGHNHRMGLDDGVLIKDNHIVAAGGVATAVKRAREGAPHTVTVEVECTTLEEVEEALGAGADRDSARQHDPRAAGGGGARHRGTRPGRGLGRRHPGDGPRRGRVGRRPDLGRRAHPFGPGGGPQHAGGPGVNVPAILGCASRAGEVIGGGNQRWT